PECQNNNIPLEEICILTKSGNELSELSKVMDNHNIHYYLAKKDFLKNHIILWLKDCASWIVGDLSVTFTDLIYYWLRLNPYSNDEDRLVKIRELYSVLDSSIQYQSDLKEWVSYILEQLSIKANVIQQNEDDLGALERFYELTESGELTDYDIKRFSQLGKPDNQVTLSTRHS